MRLFVHHPSFHQEISTVGEYISDKGSGLYRQLHALCQRLVENNPKVVADVQRALVHAANQRISVDHCGISGPGKLHCCHGEFETSNC